MTLFPKPGASNQKAPKASLQGPPFCAQTTSVYTRLTPISKHPPIQIWVPYCRSYPRVLKEDHGKGFLIEKGKREEEMWGRSASQLAGAPQGREKERMSLPTWAPPKPGVGWTESEAGPGQAAPQGCSKEGGPLSSVEFPFPRSPCPHVSDNKVRKPHVCWSDGKGPPPTQLSGDFRIPKFPGSAAVGICLPPSL